MDDHHNHMRRLVEAAHGTRGVMEDFHALAGTRPNLPGLNEALGVPDLEKWKVKTSKTHATYTIALHGKEVKVTETPHPPGSGLYLYRVFVGGKRVGTKDFMRRGDVMRTVQKAVMRKHEDAEPVEEGLPPGVTLKQKEGEQYWHVMRAGNKIGSVSLHKKGPKYDADAGEKYQGGFDSPEAAAAWIAQQTGATEDVELDEAGSFELTLKKMLPNYKELAKKIPGILQKGGKTSQNISTALFGNKGADQIHKTEGLLAWMRQMGVLGRMSGAWYVKPKREDAELPGTILNEVANPTKYPPKKSGEYNAFEKTHKIRIVMDEDHQFAAITPNAVKTFKKWDDAVNWLRKKEPRVMSRWDEDALAPEAPVLSEEMRRCRILAGLDPLPQRLVESWAHYKPHRGGGRGGKISIEQWIRDNRREIDKHIKHAVPNLRYPLDDDDREQWVMNDESLYNWARSEGVDI